MESEPSPSSAEHRPDRPGFGAGGPVRRYSRTDPDLLWKRLGLRCSVNESLRVLRPRRSQGAMALFEDARPAGTGQLFPA